MAANDMMANLQERKLKVEEVAVELGVSTSTARNIVRHEPGVLAVKLGAKQARTMYLTPESVLLRIKRRMTVV